MTIVFDVDLDAHGNIVATHSVETTVIPARVGVGADPGSPAIDALGLLVKLHKGTQPFAGTGWDQITKHPSYPGQTRHQAVIAEIIRLNDVAARTALGV